MINVSVNQLFFQTFINAFITYLLSLFCDDDNIII